GRTSYPAGLARLTPERHLLVVIDEDQLEDSASGASADGSSAATERPAKEIDRTTEAAETATVESGSRQNNQPTADVSRTEATQQPAAAAETEQAPAPSGPVADDRPEQATREIEEPTGPTPVAADNDQPAAGTP
ncbi:hypothetical protein EN801_039190, partial [Mesorhizobium sp. M00.F.Ca.ET.158.01.1.1]